MICGTCVLAQTELSFDSQYLQRQAQAQANSCPRPAKAYVKKDKKCLHKMIVL